jgi:hypothetical protein
MAEKNFFKDNFALILGLALPVVLMIGFMIVASLPQKIGEPPKYDMLFWTQDYRYNQAVPVNVNLVVKDGLLRAQYTKPNENQTSGMWPKLYLFDAKTQTVRELSFGYPDNLETIAPMREDVVEATKNMQLDTAQKSPDGFELTNENYRHYGLVNELFGGWRNDYTMKLRNGMTTVRLTTGDGTYPFYSGSVNFIAWVKQP